VIEFTSEFVYSGGLASLMLLFLAIELGVLIVTGRSGLHRITGIKLVGLLGGGATLMLALLLVQKEAQWYWILGCAAGALACHLIDLSDRLGVLRGGADSSG